MGAFPERIDNHGERDMKLKTTLLILMAHLLVGLSATTTLAQCCGESRLSEVSRATLEKVIGSFSAMGSVHMEASVRVFISGSLTEGSEDVMKNGSFSFWEEDGRFRIKGEIDPRLGLAPNMEFAFDGVNYQTLLTEDGTLSVLSEDPDRYPTAVPNPLFLVVDFLSPDQSQCPTCTLFLKDFQDESTWSARLEEARESETKSTAREIFVPSESRNGNGVIYRITFNDDKQIHKIDRLTTDGIRRLASLDFHAYRPAGERGPSFPRSITMTSYTPDGAVAARIDYEIETLEIDQPIGLNVFSIPTDGLRVAEEGATVPHAERRP
jgi:hypothetical protein